MDTDKKIIKKVTSKSFVVFVINAVIGLLFMMFIATFIVPFIEDFPAFQRIIFQFVSVAPWLLGLVFLLLIPAIVQHFIAVKNGAPLFVFSTPPRRHQPWPAHTDAGARRTSWGGLDTKNDIRGRQTKVKELSDHAMVFTPLLSRKIRVFALVLTGLALLLTYPVTHLIVYEVVPPHVQSVRHLTYMTWPLLVFWGAIILVFGVWMFSTTISVAKIDKSKNDVSLHKQRFFGLLNKIVRPDTESLTISEVAGLQIISYRARNTRRNKRLLDQYELNLVLNDGTRKMLSKQSGHKTIQQDAIQLARFLKLPIWDRSGYYYPDDPAILHPVDPLIRPL